MYVWFKFCLPLFQTQIVRYGAELYKIIAVQFCPWDGMVMYDNDFDTNENKI